MFTEPESSLSNKRMNGRLMGIICQVANTIYVTPEVEFVTEDGNWHCLRFKCVIGKCHRDKSWTSLS